MELSFNQVESVFVERFDLAPGRLAAFRSRLQHLRRLGFPTGVNTGRGRHAPYGWLQIVQMMVALDFIDLGLSPETTAMRIVRNTDKLVSAAHAITRSFDTLPALRKALIKGRCPISKTMILVSTAGALSLTQGSDEGTDYFGLMRGTEFTKSLMHGEGADPAVFPAALYLDFGARLILTAQIVGRQTQTGPDYVAHSLARWAAQVAFDDER